jgi:hypothetical protein
MVDQVMKNSWFAVNSVDSLLVSIIQQAKISPEKVSSQ